MYLSKRSNGIYYLWYHDENGRKQKTSTRCRSKAEALRFFREFKQDELKRKVAITRKSLKVFFEEYKIYSSSIHTVKTRKSIENAFNEFIRIVGDNRLNHIGIREIEGFLALKKGEASEWTARKYYIHLRSAFETARRWNYLAENPFIKVHKPKVAEVQPVYFSREELQALLKSIPEEWFKEFVLFALFTGMRLGELIHLQWNDVDTNARMIHVRNTEIFKTKSKKNRSLPMNEQLYRMIISMQQRMTSELVFHRRSRHLTENWASKVFKGCVRAAGLNERLHFHSLRHTFASWLVQSGASIYEVQKLLGHSNISVTQVYSHLRPETLHSTVNKISLQLN